MKKILMILVVVGLLLGCDYITFLDKKELTESVLVTGSVLLPKNIGTPVATYVREARIIDGEYETYKIIDYQVDEKKIEQLVKLLESTEILMLAKKDALVFQYLECEWRYDLKMVFENGDRLFVYEDGSVSLFKPHRKNTIVENYYANSDFVFALRNIFRLEELVSRNPNEEIRKVDRRNINEELVKEIKLMEATDRQVYVLDDGLLVFNLVIIGISTRAVLRVIKYDFQGNLLWYKDFTQSNELKAERESFLATSDGGFIFSFYDEREGLIKCDKNGEFQWQHFIEMEHMRIFRFLEGQRGEIYVIGAKDKLRGYYSDGHAPTDIGMIKYSKAGELLSSRVYGGDTDKAIAGCEYRANLGIIIWGKTNPLDDESIKKEKEIIYSDFLIVFDENLKKSWQYQANQEPAVKTPEVQIIGDDIYLVEVLTLGNSDIPITKISLIDTEKKELYKSAVIKEDGLIDFQKTQDGNMLLLYTIYNPKTEDFVGNKVYLLDEYLQYTLLVDDPLPSNWPAKLIPTDDNGFFVLQYSNIGYLPKYQGEENEYPRVAVILSRYAFDGFLLYRKIYNQDRALKMWQEVIPLANSQVIVEY